MRAVRRAVLLCGPALCTLVSCGIPATGVVEAGGPAHGIVPMVRVYLVENGSLVAVPRRPADAVDAESAVKNLLEGPTEAERAKRLTTLLPPLEVGPTLAPTPDASVPPAAGPADAPSGGSAVEAPASATVSVNARRGVVSIQLRYVTEELADLAVAQLICTAAEAQRTSDTGTGIGAEAVAVKVTNGRGWSVEGSDGSCPDG
ncbi:hypothetical protein G9272_34785 [Streptomyces asoensis]|uniref:Lipoprotein n=1 Tax=Streptomyces asoensis TaxID=249586 RepID=A0A6M4WZ51_9ACTN|nr:hypothetical protein [Streptomyces asoensis]QJT04831.1 hypothetical protein G9272_34785 [Streptomyces asoensis]